MYMYTYINVFTLSSVEKITPKQVSRKVRAPQNIRLLVLVLAPASALSLSRPPSPTYSVSSLSVFLSRAYSLAFVTC